MMDKVQKIRAFLVGIADADGVSTILAKAIENKILPYIDSLQEEPVSEDLESEIQRYYVDWDEHPQYVQTARHFAKWQKKQMMKDAVDGKVVARYPKALPSLYDAINIHIENDTKSLKEGDNIKVIIIKED